MLQQNSIAQVIKINFLLIKAQCLSWSHSEAVACLWGEKYEVISIVQQCDFVPWGNGSCAVCCSKVRLWRRGIQASAALHIQPDRGIPLVEFLCVSVSHGVVLESDSDSSRCDLYIPRNLDQRSNGLLWRRATGWVQIPGGNHMFLFMYQYCYKNRDGKI